MGSDKTERERVPQLSEETTGVAGRDLSLQTHLPRDGHTKPTAEPADALAPPDHLGSLQTARLATVRTRLGARLDDLGRDTDETRRQLAGRGGEHVNERRR